jgi:ABC-type antimicrobial peptide transport system permease subunit
MLKHFFKIAFRNILKHKTYSLIVLAGLALGMISCIYITLWVQDELGWDRFHQNYENLYRFIVKMSDGWTETSPLALVPNMRGKYPDIEKMTRFSPKEYNIKFGDINSSELGALIDRDFFEMFSFPFIKGDVQINFNNSNSIILTERLAKKIFLSSDPIGRSLIINNDRQFIISGILKDIPENSHIRFDFLLPIRQMRDGADQDWSYDCVSYLTLNENVNLNAFQDKISPFIRENDTMDWEVVLQAQSFRKIHMYSLNGTDPILYIYIFLGLALVILFIGCVNFINLATGRSVFRAKEIGLRKVVGAEKNDIIKQFIGESVTLSFIALLMAIIASSLLFPLLNQLSGKQIAFSDLFSSYNLLGALVLAFLTGLAAGSYPALLLSSFTPIKTVKGKIQFSTGSKFLRRIFVSAQFIVTVILIIITLTLYRQLNYMWNMDLGFNKDQVISIPMNEQLWNVYSALKETLKQNPNIINVTSAYNNPTDISHTNLINWQGNSFGKPITIKDQSVDYDYFDLFEMDIIEGRAFSKEFPNDDECFILNEEAVKLIGYSSPIGKLITVWAKEGSIIGVVKNFHSSSFHEKIKPIVFMLSERHGPRTNLFVKLKAHDISKSLQFIKEKTTYFAPNNQFEYTFLDDVFADQYKNDQRRSVLYRVFTILAIIISCLGLYGFVTLVLSSKTKEIGIRKILGATVTEIIALVSREFMILICISTFIGWSVSYFVINIMLDNYAYKAGISIWIFINALIIILFLAVLSVASSVVKAALINPLDSLKHD